MAKCPNCEKPVSSLNYESIGINAGGASLPGNAYCCPTCGSILGAEMDPIAIRTDLEESINHEVSQLGDRLDRIGYEVSQLREKV